MIFNNVVAYQLDKGQLPDSAEDFALLIEPQRFTDLLSTEDRRTGFFPPTDASDELVVDIGGGTLVAALRTDKRSVPGSTLRMMLKEKEKQAEAQQGGPVGRKQRKEMREDLMDQLLPKVLPATSILFIIIHGEQVFIGASNLNASDNAVGFLLTALQGVGLEFPFTTRLPGSMTQWLLEDSVDGAGLSVSDFAILEGDGSSIQWKNHEADEDDVQKYINQGKSVTRIRLEYHDTGSELDPITFTLNDKGIIQQVKLHQNEDGDTQGGDAVEGGDSDPMSVFMSDAAITATIMSRIVNSVSEALGDND